MAVCWRGLAPHEVPDPVTWSVVDLLELAALIYHEHEKVVGLVAERDGFLLGPSLRYLDLHRRVRVALDPISAKAALTPM